MTVFRPRLRGLVSKLALFYVLLSLPTLIVVESAILIYEFQRFTSGVRDSSLDRAAQRGALELSDLWPHLRGTGAGDTTALQLWLDAWILRLQQPHGGLTPDESYVLLELTDVPLGAAIVDADASVLAKTGGDVNWRLDLPSREEIAAALQRQETSAIELSGSSGSYTIQRVLVPLQPASGKPGEFLFVELRVPSPWRHLLFDTSFESPTVFAFLIVFGLASSIFLAAWVTRRLSRIARAATAWSRGDFSNRIDDRSGDEIGGLSRMLDGMALDLKSLLRSRAQLATLAERQRLARDLHDTVKQKAFAMNLQLATLRRQLGEHMVGERILQVERLSQQIQHDLGQILDELRAPDAHMPFAERLRLRAQDWAQVGQIDLDLNLAATPDFPPEVDEALVRIVDEALSNVLRHSAATRVVIDLRVDHGELVLEITDDGRGMSPTAIPGMGLVNMRERACSLPGGEFALQSTDTGGVRIRVTARPSP